MKTPEVTKNYRNSLNLSLRGFADAINEKLINTNVSHATVARWEDEEKPREPDLRLLFECIATYPNSWIASWAIEIISAMYPDLVQSGVIAFNLRKVAQPQGG